MRKMRMFSLVVAASASLFALAPFAAGQDSPSLGDAARQARLQKQQKEAQAKDEASAASQDAANKDAANKDAANKEAPSKDAATKNSQPASPKKAVKVVTNEEIPEHVGPVARPHNSGAGYQQGNGPEPPPAATEANGEALKSQIVSMKNDIASLQSQIDSLNDSIHFAPGNCVTNCVQWNERQVEKQQQVEQMKAQLEDQKKRLEDVQESARRQGFGSSVYDP
jgi:hypothetical protein